MANIRNSRIIPIALVLIITAIAIAAIVSLARAVFFSGSTQSNTTQVDTSRESLLSTTDGHQVRMTVRGGIVADEAFYSYRIVISPSSRTLTTYNGYLGTVVDQVTLGNNVKAYDEFVHALDKANLAAGKQLPDDENDTRGICATGLLYEFDIMDATSTVKNLWTSTCNGSQGSLSASVGQVKNLFTTQIPGAASYLNKISL